MEDNLERAILLVDSANGIYVPQVFAQGLPEDAKTNVAEKDMGIILEGPENEFYWETWGMILDNAVIVDRNGDSWILYQDGDLWALPFSE